MRTRLRELQEEAHDIALHLVQDTECVSVAARVAHLECALKELSESAIEAWECTRVARGRTYTDTELAIMRELAREEKPSTALALDLGISIIAVIRSIASLQQRGMVTSCAAGWRVGQ